MVVEIKPLFAATDILPVTLASIAAANGRITDQEVNTTTRFKSITLYARIQAGATGPTAGRVYQFYLMRDDAHATVYRSDGLGTVDAAVSVKPPNANFLFSIEVDGTDNQVVFGDFYFENPGPLWSVVFWNDTDQAISTTEADSFIHFMGENPEAQT